MNKKITLLFCISSFLLATANDKDKEFRRKKIVALGSAVVVGIGLGAASIALPIIFPGGVLLGLKGVVGAAMVKASASGVATTATATALKIGGAAKVAAPVATFVGPSIWVARKIRPSLVSTPEEDLARLEKERAARLLNAQTELTECLTKNKFTFGKDAVNPPSACEHQARVFEFMSGKKAFNN